MPRFHKRLLFIQMLLAASVAAFSNSPIFIEKTTDFASKTIEIGGLQLICPPDLTIATVGTTCAATVVLPNVQTQNSCTPNQISLSVSSALGVGVGPFFNVAAGVYPITVTASNGCGDVASCSFKLTVRDQKKPTPVVVQEMWGNITGDGHITLEATVFNLNSSDNCTPKNALRISFSQNLLDTVRTFDCDSLGDRTVPIWVTDEAGNSAVKNSLLHVWDALGACHFASVSGKITTETGESVQNVVISSIGPSFFPQIETSENGSFSLQKLHAGDTFALAPQKNINPLNGVSTLDLSLIAKHILSNKKLDSPYKIIAADVNRSGAVTTADLVQLRQLILGEIPDFKNNQSWRFVEKSHVFSNPSVPFGDVLPETKWFAPLTTDVSNLDFVAIKIGDVSGDALPNNVETETDDRSVKPFFLKITDRFVEKNERVEIPIRATLSQLEGLQATLHFDANSLVFNDLKPNEAAQFSFQNFGTSHLADGQLPFSWLPDGSLFSKIKPTAEVILFTVTCRATASGRLSDFIALSPLPTPAEAFDDVESQAYFVKLLFEDEATLADFSPLPRLELMQNAPNPFSEETKIAFSTPETGAALLQIFDEMGREVWRLDEAELMAGNHEIRLKTADFEAKMGIFTYRLSTAAGSMSRKMHVQNR